MRVKLTQKKIEKLKAPDKGRIEVSDSECIGLKLRISSSGAMTWLYQKQIRGGVRRGFALGSYPELDVTEARDLAAVIKVEAQNGIDRVLAAELAAVEAAEKAAALVTTADVLEKYVKDHIERNLKVGQSRTERTRQLRIYLKPLFHRDVSSITRAELQRIVNSKASEGKIVMANRLRAALCAFFAWAHGFGYIETDPAVAVRRAGKETSRKRTPSLQEVAQMWEASFAQGEFWGPYFRLCILTGQRCREDILKMEWKWVDFEKLRYEIPIPKNELPHIVHLSPVAMAEILSLQSRKIEGCQFVFSTNGKTAASGVTKAVDRWKACINIIRAGQGLDPIEPWVLHDLRRSQATALAEAGFDETVVDRIQNHVAGGSRASAVAAVYNKAQRLPERAKALNAWADMVTGRSDNVVHIADRRAV
jgi:integrase